MEQEVVNQSSPSSALFLDGIFYLNSYKANLLTANTLLFSEENIKTILNKPTH